MYLKKVLEDQVAGWKKIEELKRINLLKLREGVSVGSLSEVFERGASSVREILNELITGGMSFENTDPGHGLGHFIRDYLNAMRLAARLSADPKDIFIGILGGAFHDIGCAFMGRYDEPTRLIKHAEAAALVLEHIFSLNNCGLNRAEQLLVEYGAAAHTHYLKPNKFKFNGETYFVEPYRDEEDGKPILAVWFPRWVDRLDCNGPTFVGRYYLTLVEPRKDFSGEGYYYEVKFADHLRPLLRSSEEIKADGGKQTMLEHLNMFAKSQTNTSPYGKHDFGAMSGMRDRQTARLNRIIAARSLACGGGEERTFHDWNLFLAKNIEPTKSGVKAVAALGKAFSELPEVSKSAWTSCFSTALDEYFAWEAEVRIDFRQMRRQGLPQPEEALLGIISPAY